MDQQGAEYGGEETINYQSMFPEFMIKELAGFEGPESLVRGLRNDTEM